MFRGWATIRKFWRKYSAWAAVTLLLLAVVGWIVGASESFQGCIQQPRYPQSAAQPKEDTPLISGAWRGLESCVGVFLGENGEAITALFTVVLAVSTILLWQQTKLLAEGDREALQVTERAFVVPSKFNRELTTRADATDVFATEFTTSDPGLFVTRFTVQPVWANNGSTPTKNMRINVDWSLGEQHRVGSYRNPDRQFFVAPKSIETDEFIEMPGLNELIQDGVAGALGPVPLMLIWGRADYDDVFGKHHWIQWCYRVRPARPDAEKLRVGFIQWGDYNGSDEDAKH